MCRARRPIARPGLINLTRNLGGSVGISLVAAAQSHMAQVSQNTLAGNVTADRIRSMPRGCSNLQGALLAAGSDPVQAAHQAQAVLYGELLRQSSMVAYVDVFRLLAWVCVGLIPLMFFMKPIKPGAGPAGRCIKCSGVGRQRIQPQK